MPLGSALASTALGTHLMFSLLQQFPELLIGHSGCQKCFANRAQNLIDGRACGCDAHDPLDVRPNIKSSSRGLLY